MCVLATNELSWLCEYVTVLILTIPYITNHVIHYFDQQDLLESSQESWDLAKMSNNATYDSFLD